MARSGFSLLLTALSPSRVPRGLPHAPPTLSSERGVASRDEPDSSFLPPPPGDSRPSARLAMHGGPILRIRRKHRSPKVQLAAATTNHADTILLHHLCANAGTHARGPAPNFLYGGRALGHEAQLTEPVRGPL